MFNGRKERELLEELEKANQQNKRKRGILKEICNQKEEAARQLDRAASSHEKAQQQAGQMKEELAQLAELADSMETEISDIRSTVIQVNNTVESFDANHSVFLDQMKQQNGMLMEALEENKKISAPVENIAEVPSALQSGNDSMQKKLEEMRDFSRNISTLSLNAAIEAGRLGEAGSKFITVAEEIRNFSDQYDNTLRMLSEQLRQSEVQALELQKQVEQLIEAVRQHTKSMGKLAADSMQNLSGYESNQLELHGVIQDALVARTDDLLQSKQDAVQLKDSLSSEMQELLGALGEQKNAVSELRSMDQILQQNAAKGLEG